MIRFLILALISLPLTLGIAAEVRPAETPPATEAAETDPVNRALWAAINHTGSVDTKLRETILAATPSGDADVLLWAWERKIERDDEKNPREWLRLAAQKGSVHAVMEYAPSLPLSQAEELLKPFVGEGNPHAAYILAVAHLRDAAKKSAEENQRALELMRIAAAGTPEGHPSRKIALCGLGVAEMHAAKTPADFALSARHSLAGRPLDKWDTKPPYIPLILLSRGDDEALAQEWTNRLLQHHPVVYPKPAENPGIFLIEDVEPLNSPRRYAARLLKNSPPSDTIKFMRLYDISVDQTSIPILLPAVAAGDATIINAVAHLAKPVWRSESKTRETRPWQLPLLDALKIAAAKRVPEAVNAFFDESDALDSETRLDNAIANLVAGGTAGLQKLDERWVRPYRLTDDYSPYDHQKRRTLKKPRELNPHFLFFETLTSSENWRTTVDQAASNGNPDALYIRGLLRRSSNRQDIRDLGLADMRRLVDRGDALAMIYFARITDDDEEKDRLLDAAAATGNADALFASGVLYLKDRNKKPADPREAYRRIRLAAEKESVNAVSELVKLLKKHPEALPSPEEASKEHAKWEKILSENFDWRDRSPVSSDSYRDRMDWMNSLAEKGDAVAAILLGMELRDPGRRYQALRQAADAGIPEAFMLKAEMHREKGQFFSLKEADVCVKRAAELGLESAKVLTTPASTDTLELRKALEKKAMSESGVRRGGAKETLLAMILNNSPTTEDLAQAERLLDTTARYSPPPDDLWSHRLAMLRKDYRKALYHLVRLIVSRQDSNQLNSLDTPRKYFSAPQYYQAGLERNGPDGFPHYTLVKLASRGHPPAMRRLADWHIIQSDNPAAAKPLLESLSKSGFPGAERRLALLLATYPTSAADLSEGVARLEKLAATKKPAALLDLAMFAPVKSFEELRDKALSGDQRARLQLAYLLARNTHAKPHPLLPETLPQPSLARAYLGQLIRPDKSSDPAAELGLRDDPPAPSPEPGPSIIAIIYENSDYNTDKNTAANARVHAEIDAYKLKQQQSRKR